MKKNSKALKATAILIGIIFVTGTILPGGAAMAQIAPPPGLFQLPLNQVQVPEPPMLFQFVKNKPAAIKLGKAFFWDMQVGSDGVQACATCHFHAGADNRRKNTVNPGSRAAIPDTAFSVKGPGETLVNADWPFHLRQNPDFQSSPILRDSNDVVGSQGVLRMDFVSVVTGSAVDNCTPQPDTVFSAGGVNTRRVTARNTPSNINAVFNFHNFWDGRAHYIFNGENPFGPMDTNAGVWFNDVNNNLTKQPVTNLEVASLASQAVGPPLDDTEMSCKGRTFPELGRKMLSLLPLGKQMVHPNDSVLGPMSKAVREPNGKISGLPGLKDPVTGLNATYEQMIRDSFVNSLWSNPLPAITVTTVSGPVQFKQIEANFAFFWGLAIQLYEATLVSDQTPFDRFLGGDQTALDATQVNGMNLFFGAGKCDACHGGTELTSASFAAAGFITNVDNGLIDQMPVASGVNAIYDVGFNDTAVRPITDDIGRGGNGPFTNVLTGQPTPLSYCAQSELQKNGNLPFPSVVMPEQIPATIPVTNDGAFKVPGLRNVELTAPYFHDGGTLTLEDVVDFYTRGGNFPQANINHLDFNMTENGALQNQPTKMAELVAFMMSLTDERVRKQSAPFDHPELFIPNGDNPGLDGLTRIPAKDANGFDAPAFALTIDRVPAVTNKPALLVSGTQAGGATVAVKVNNGAAVPAEAPTATTWRAQVSGFTGGLNDITVTATDVDGSVVTLTTSLSVIFADGCFNCAGAVSVIDAIKALRIAVGLIDPTNDDLLHGDVSPLVNGVPTPNGRIDVSDALVVLKKAVGLVSF